MASFPLWRLSLGGAVGFTREGRKDLLRRRSSIFRDGGNVKSGKPAPRAKRRKGGLSGTGSGSGFGRGINPYNTLELSEAGFVTAGREKIGMRDRAENNCAEISMLQPIAESLENLRETP